MKNIKTRKTKEYSIDTVEKSSGQLENSQYVYELVNKWIENADNKVGVSCALFTGAYGVVTFLSETISNPPKGNSAFEYVYYSTLILSVILFILAVVFYAIAINPNLGQSGNESEDKKYPIYYGDIASLSLCNYKKIMTDASEKDLIDELWNETHYNSGICYKKMKKYRIGLWLSFASLVVAVISGVSHYFM